MPITLSNHENTLIRAKALASQLVELRRQIHSHPELSFEERETQRLVSGILNDLGYDVRPGLGGTGVMAEIGEGRTIAIRADMDALPIQESSDRPYASIKPGVMHACGHDVHTTCALGAAMLIAETPPKEGRVRFLFQPAEETVNHEGKSGATLMIEQGATENAESILALHVDPRLPVGQIGVRDGHLLAACDSFDISIKGIGSHGAYPDLGVDAVVLASQVVQAIQTIVSRRKSPLKPAVLTIGGIRSETYAPNILVEQVSLTGTVRYFDHTLHNLIRKELEGACSIATALGGSYEMRYSHDTPALTNDPQLSNLVRFVGRQLLGKDNVIEPGLEMGGDDFSFLSSHMPGCYFLLGTRIEGSLRKVHTPEFDIDEAAIPIGAAMLAASALQYLGS